MSLVAYTTSSDEDSGSDEETELAVVSTLHTNKSVASKTLPLTTILDEHISDEDDDFMPIKVDLQQLKKITLSLPAPKTPNDDKTLSQELENKITPAFAKLPTPKSCSIPKSGRIEEEDDEFLRKKAVPSVNEEQWKPLPPAGLLKGPVKITIPSLKEYSDVDKEIANKAKSRTECIRTPKGCGLLSILPKAKSEQDFSKSANGPSVNTNSTTTSRVPTLIPDTVKNRRPAKNTEIVDGPKTARKKPPRKPENPKMSLVDCSDSDDDDDASDNEADSGKDFFSLNSADTLPEVSANEINVMVANRAAQMAEAKNKYLNSTSTSNEGVYEKTVEEEEEEEVMQQSRKRYYDQQNLDSKAMQALVGGSMAKRRRQQKEIKIMDISCAEIRPNRDEWMRTALASSTGYQPTGVLVDEEPASGTRRKHQITYLAHKAKANEAELQAMWSANRQTRRVAQSKYGF